MPLKEGISKALRVSPSRQRDGVGNSTHGGESCVAKRDVKRASLRALNTEVLLAYLLVTKPAGYQCFATEYAELVTVARSTGAASGKDEAELCLTLVAAT